MLGVKQSYGSDANDIPMREPFKWLAVAGPPMTNYWALNPQAFGAPFSSNNDGRSVEEQDGVPGSLLETYKQLIAVRHASEALRRGDFRVLGADNGVYAFEVLYRAHIGRVYAICLRLTASEAEAEDAAQETFIRAWQKLGAFEGRSALSTWLHRLAVNHVIDRRRSRAVRRVVEETADVADADPPAPRRERDATIDLERAIAALPDGARAVYVLHEIEGYRHEEIADLMGTAPGTSKAQLHRARQLLRKALTR